jgi:mannose-6-phosphate isomerase-like protein (cupin superfamily)
MLIRSFNPDALFPAHEGTILAQGVFASEEIGAPFGCAFGVLKPGMAQKPERVPVAKLYYVRQGEATLQIEDEEQVIREGDVVFIPANAYHTVRNHTDRDFSTFAIWWTPPQGGEP